MVTGSCTQVRRLESQGLTSKQAEAITAVITEVLNDILENVGQTFTSIHEAQRVSFFLPQRLVLIVIHQTFVMIYRFYGAIQSRLSY